MFDRDKIEVVGLKVESLIDSLRYYTPKLIAENPSCVHYHIHICAQHDKPFILRCDGLDNEECGVFGGRGDLCDAMEGA